MSSFLYQEDETVILYLYSRIICNIPALTVLCLQLLREAVLVYKRWRYSSFRLFDSVNFSTCCTASVSYKSIHALVHFFNAILKFAYFILSNKKDSKSWSENDKAPTPEHMFSSWRSLIRYATQKVLPLWNVH